MAILNKEREYNLSNLIGKSLGRYHILEQLGEGGMAVVYKAFDTRLEAEVAVKVIRTDNILPNVLERALKRFEREAKAVARLNHLNIVNITDYGDFEGHPYLVMPYLKGGTLKEMLKGKAMDWQKASQLLIPIAKALGYAHHREMIHRDVKPANILITETGEPLLTDFGVAKIIDDEATMDLTGTHATVGSPEYMAPEQVTAKNVDLRADIYALGVVFYEMVTGRKPFQADTPMAVLFKHASEPLPRPTQFVPKLPKRVEQILLKALAKDPANRYQSMGEFAVALDKLADGVGKPEQKKRKTVRDGSKKTKKISIPPRIIWLLVLGVIGIGLFYGASRLVDLGQMEELIPTHEITLTLTPAFTHTPMASTTSNFLFAENFEDGIAQGVMYIYGDWGVNVDDADNLVYEVDNTGSSDYAGFDFGSDSWEIDIIEYRTKMLDHTSGAPEVILYFGKNSNSTTGYVQSLAPYWNSVEISKAGNGSGWQPFAGREFLFELDRWYQIKLLTEGERFRVYIDEILVIDTTGTPAGAASLTFQVGPGAHVLLDDIRVRSHGE